MLIGRLVKISPAPPPHNVVGCCKIAISNLQSVRTVTSSQNVGYGLEKKWAYYNQEAINSEAEKPFRRLTPTQLMFAGKSTDGRTLLRSSQFLQKELPRRIARRVKDFQSLPYVAAINPNIQEVYELYLRAFHKLSSFGPINTRADEEEYSKLIQFLLDDHNNVVSSLAKAFHEVKHLIPYEVLGSLTERTLRSRLAIRLLAEHHIGLRNVQEDFIGVICTRTSPKRIIEKCVYNSRLMCEHSHGHSPSVLLSGHTKTCFPYFPKTLEYILQELLKNSMKSTVLYHKNSPLDSSSVRIPPIGVTICNNEDSFVIRISDRGGGIPESRMKEVFKYSVSTSFDEQEEIFNNGGAFDAFIDAANVAGAGGRISGYGFGLPSSRAYAEFLGGTLTMVPMVGLGTDVFLKLAHLTSDSIKI